METNYFRKVAFTEDFNDDIDMPIDFDNYAIDMNKCRKKILVNSDYKFCSYSVLDNLELFDGKITDGI